MKPNQQRQFYATAPTGLQHLLAAEITSLGASEVKVAGAGVQFSGSLETAYCACLWSRIANRILMPIHRQAVSGPDELYDCVRKIDWSEHMDVDQTLAVDFFTSQSEITHSQYGALKVKDAVVDQFREAFERRPSVDRDVPDLRINVYLHRNHARVAIDLSGHSLHRRGYRAGDVVAPLKENLAAALLIASDWPAKAARGEPFIDPMCGSGTFLIEAAMIAADTAPAIKRNYFGFKGWRGHDAAAWQQLLEDAQQRAHTGNQRLPEIVGNDSSKAAFDIATSNIEQAGFSANIRLSNEAIGLFGRELGNAADHSLDSNQNTSEKIKTGLMLFNPPYGKRLKADHTTGALYQEIGRIVRRHFTLWDVGLLVPEDGFAHRLRIDFTTRLKLSNGGIACKLLHAKIDAKIVDGRNTNTGATDTRKPDAKSETTANQPTAGENSSVAATPALATRAENNPMFANRLAKNLKKMSRWARQNDVNAYRVYDADMPEYAVAIDIYQACPVDSPNVWVAAKQKQTECSPASRFDPARAERYVVLQEYKAPANVDPQRAAERLQTVMTNTPQVLECDSQHLFLKERKRQRGSTQYEKSGNSGTSLITQEQGCNLIVNLQDYLDTGLFLDHRKVRQFIQANAKGKHFLNLFCYTGAATAHAILGGAKSSLSIDLSSRYLEWAERNFALNTKASDSSQHKTLNADVTAWLQETSNITPFDLIFLDPPTFSNSSSMEHDWDVQNDHANIIKQCMRLLQPDGLLIFSTNSRRFKFERDALEAFHCEDKSAWSIQADFARNQRIHQCWFINHPS